LAAIITAKPVAVKKKSGLHLGSSAIIAAHSIRRASETCIGADAPRRAGSGHERGAKTSGTGVAGGEGGKEEQSGLATAAVAASAVGPRRRLPLSSASPRPSSHSSLSRQSRSWQSRSWVVDRGEAKEDGSDEGGVSGGGELADLAPITITAADDAVGRLFLPLAFRGFLRCLFSAGTSVPWLMYMCKHSLPCAPGKVIHCSGSSSQVCGPHCCDSSSELANAAADISASTAANGQPSTLPSSPRTAEPGVSFGGGALKMANLQQHANVRV